MKHKKIYTETPIKLLGQSGCKLTYNDCTIFVDPYLSNSVQELDSDNFKRLVEIPLSPTKIFDADWVLITHKHIDHCDPHTLPALSKASPQAYFIGPAPVLSILSSWGINGDRLVLAKESGIQITADLKVHAVPAAHMEIYRNDRGELSCVGYAIESNEHCLYLAGDTCVKQEVIDALKLLPPITTTLLPVNEHNYFREKQGIVGNMSPREAFLLAQEIGVETVIPAHWDMFAINSTSQEEIQAVYNNMEPDFVLAFSPDTVRT